MSGTEHVDTVSRTEHVDAVVVGARCAGTATGIALARAGRDVVAIDRSRFPSDTLSTHLLWAGGVAELRSIGALDRVEALGAPRLPHAVAGIPGSTVTASYTPVDGIDYGMCVRRTGLDAALVETAREAGVRVREGTTAAELIWAGDRVVGVRCTDRGGACYELRAPLVIGADGRRSLVARRVGAETPRRLHHNGRACWFAYWRDGRPEWRSTAAQWRVGAELGTAFPCDDGLVLVLLMPPVERAQGVHDLEREYVRTIAGIPELADRLRGCTRETRVRATTDTTSYFRRSAGPGWALVGDAGHFKDPVTAQGIRDAVRFGRLLGEAVAPVLGDPRALDRALRSWERRRDRECRATYHWTNLLGRAGAVTPFEIELYRAASVSPVLGTRLLDVLSRIRGPLRALPPHRLVRLGWRAFRSGARSEPEGVSPRWRAGSSR